MSFVPGAETATLAADKIIRYLLDPAHPGNAGKDAFFRSVGFSPARWQVMRKALLQHLVVNPIASTRHSPFGVKYVVDCSLPTPDQRNPCIRSVWIASAGSAGLSFVTAYPHLG